MSNTPLKWALWLAERGFLIAPLPEGSKSAKGGAKWSEIYTTDADRIRTWFEVAPKMNYLVCPGEGYGIVDLDMGEDKDGIARWEELEAKHGMSPNTFTVRTWSGGRHIYYKVPEPVGSSVSKIAHGIDVRGEGGYVVGPGSQIEGKFYEVIDVTETADAPEWVADKMSQVRARDDDVDTPLFELDLTDNVNRARAFLAKRAPAIEGEGGDEHTYVTICMVRELGISKDKAMELIMAEGGWNDRNEPPWEGSEMMVKADNAYSFAKDRQGSKGGVMELYEPDDMVDVDDLVMPDEVETREDFSEYMLRGEGLWEADTYQRYIIPEWLPDSGYACVLARRGVGKTTAMIDIASCISTDIEWHDWPVLKGYHAVYFCGEHDTVALQLLRAWRDHNAGIDVADNGRFIFLRNAGDLIDKEKTANWAKFLRQEIGPEGKAVVFLDTWQRATSAASQNDDAEMQKATHNAERLATFLGGPMVVAVHPPKAEGEVVMGSSIIENNSVAILTLEGTGGNRKHLEVTRMKGRGEGNYMDLEFEVIDLGEKDEHGRDVTGQAVSKTGGTHPIPGEPDTVTPDSSTATSTEDKTEKHREILGDFLILFRSHLPHGMSATKVRKTDVANEIIRIKKKAAKDLTDVEKELRRIGGDTLFKDISPSPRNFTNLMDTCFDTTSVCVKYEGEEWDVGFNKTILKITETI